MNLSHKLTISLASLVILLAFVFATTSVMAHSTNVATHTHPLTTTVEEDLNGDGDIDDLVTGEDGNDGDERILPHDHPTVTLSADGNRHKLKIVVDDADTANVVEDEFTLFLEFSEKVAADRITNSITSATAVPINAGQFTILAINESTKDTISSISDSFTITRVSTDDTLTKYKIVVNVNSASLGLLAGDSTADPVVPPVDISYKIRFNVNNVYNLQTRPVLDLIPGVSNDASNILALTLTSGTVDVTNPTLAITHDPADGTNVGANNQVNFTFTFSEALAATGAGMFTADDVTVSANGTKGTLASATATAPAVAWTLPVTLADPYADVTVTVGATSITDTGGNSLAANVMETYTAPPPDPAGVITVPANSYIIVVRDADHTKLGAGGVEFKKGIKTVEWAGMPNLRALFDISLDRDTGKGGALILERHSGNAAPGTVGISEIMWALDAAYFGRNDEAATASQWIELHNLNPNAVKVKMRTLTGLQTYAVANNLVELNADGVKVSKALAAPMLDVAANGFTNQPGDPTAWEAPGANGSSGTAVDFASMARKIIDEGKGTNFQDKKDHRYNNRDGRNPGHWKESTVAYRSKVLVKTDADDEAYHYLGSPGAPSDSKAPSQDKTATRRDIPASPVIFNEIANHSDDKKAYEWIELLAVTNVNLRNYLISIVTSNTSDAILYQFPDKDLNVAAGKVLLLVDSEPKDNPNHPLEVGYNVDKTEYDQRRGLHDNLPRYKVTDFAGMGLPDDGKFVLILRSPDGNGGQRSGADAGKGVAERGKDDLDKVVDAAGWDDNLKKGAYPNIVSKTDVWPFHAMGSINGFTRNKLEVNKVHYRQHRTTKDGRAGIGAVENKNEDGKAAFRDAGYTGIGYKRHMAKSNVNGGTPGYHGVEKGKVADGATLVVSEIMLNQNSGRRTGLPQWIEIYNPTNYAVQLDADDGWRIVIEEERTALKTINFKTKGNVKRVLPGETIIVVSAPTRNYGYFHNQSPRSSVKVFPQTRVFNVWQDGLKDHFRMTDAASPILDPNSFNLTLMDGKGATSDMIGNLDGNVRTSDEAAWEFSKATLVKVPNTNNGAGPRTSLIRIFDDGVARSGLSAGADAKSNVLPIGAKKKDDTVDLRSPVVGGGSINIPEAYAWIRTSQTNFGNGYLQTHTWYGSRDDYGTPMNRLGQPLPVTLSFFRPTLEDGKVTIRWTTESELDNAGFNILRSETRNGEFTQVNEQMIQGNGTTAERSTYKWVDTTAKPGAVYYYQIEDVSFAGEHTTLATTKLKGLISAKGKLTTQWGELKNLR